MPLIVVHPAAVRRLVPNRPVAVRRLVPSRPVAVHRLAHPNGPGPKEAF